MYEQNFNVDNDIVLYKKIKWIKKILMLFYFILFLCFCHHPAMFHLDYVTENLLHKTIPHKNKIFIIFEFDFNSMIYTKRERDFVFILILYFSHWIFFLLWKSISFWFLLKNIKKNSNHEISIIFFRIQNLMQKQRKAFNFRLFDIYLITKW